MSLGAWSAAAAALGSVLAAVIAAAAAFWARAAAQRSNEAAGLMAEIEQQRRHRELTPQFRIRAQAMANSPYPGFAILFVMLADGELKALDAVTITILNTVDIRPWGLPQGVTEKGAEEFLWSGWEFDTFITGGIGERAVEAASHRRSKPRRLSQLDGKDWYQLLIRRTAPPEWDNWTEEKWRSKWETIPLRLSLDCRLAGHQPWAVYDTLTIEPPDAEPGSSDA